MKKSNGLAFENSEKRKNSYMRELVQLLSKHFDSEQMMDYLSYVYLGWRTTGGPWQNQVIDTFLRRELRKAGLINCFGKYTQ